jgi:hypothetical protein
LLPRQATDTLSPERAKSLAPPSHPAKMYRSYPPYHPSHTNVWNL